MSWWNKFFQSSEEEEEEIKFSSLGNWLQERKEVTEKKAKEEAQPLIQEILHEMEEMRELALKLKKKDLPQEIPHRATKVVKTSRPAFVKEILKNTTLEDVALEKFKEKFSESLDNMGKLLASKGRYLPIAFPEEMESIGKKAKQLLNYQEELENFSVEDKNLEGTLSHYEKIKQLQGELKDVTRSTKKVKSTLRKLKQERKNLEEKLRNIKQSPSLKKFLQRKEEQEKAVERKEKIERELYNFLAPLKRPLKKFRKYLQSSKEIKEMEGYLESPVSKFLHTPPENLINILKEIKQNSQEMNLKPQDLEKVEHLHSHLEDLEQFKKNYLEVEKKQKAIQEKVSSSQIMEKKEKLQEELHSLEREAGSQKKKLEKINNKKGKLEERIQELKEELPRKINNVSQRKIRIDFDS